MSASCAGLRAHARQGSSPIEAQPDKLDRRRQAVLARVEEACRTAGRDPKQVRVVAVTKSVDPETARALARLGQRDLGESRVDELERKLAFFASEGERVCWHFIGHLQRNKARRVVRLADEIHSVDSLRLIDALQRLCAEEQRRPALYLQVKLTDEPNKSGLPPQALGEALDASEGLPLAGLMTMAPLVPGAEARPRARSTFAQLAAVAAELPPARFVGGRCRLSMGMSGDFEEALAEGADLLRIGTAFFEGDEPLEGGAS
jgi:pyridoxal phosphate enzyme (YggS family)